MKEKEMDSIAGFIDEVVANIEKSDIHIRVSNDVRHLCESFPLYPEAAGS
jgi:glycine/serine hydroxymethyltransferase